MSIPETVTIPEQPAQILLSSPLMTYERFGEQTGLRENQVRGQVNLGNLPSYKLGRLVLVNVAKYVNQLSTVIPAPVMIAERFAEASGLRLSQVISQIERGNLPTRYIGRLRLIDLVALTKTCLEHQEEEAQQ